MAENRSLLKNASVQEALKEVYSYRYTPADDRIKNSKIDILKSLANGNENLNKTPWVCSNKGNKVEIYRDIIGRLAIDGQQVVGELSDHSQIDEDYLIPLLQRNSPVTNVREKFEPVLAASELLEKLKREYTQFTMQIVFMLVSEKAQANTPLHQRKNLYFDSLDKHYYLDVELSDFILRSMEGESKLLGILPGTIKMKYQWNESGFAVKEINFSNEVLASLLDQNEQLSCEELQKKLPLVYKDNNQLDLGLFQLNKLANELDDSDFKKRPVKELIRRIQTARKWNPNSAPLLSEVVLQTCSYFEFDKKLQMGGTSINENLREDDLIMYNHMVEEYTKLMNRVSKEHDLDKVKSKIIAGAMLAFVGATVVGLCCASGFGIIALPFMAWGLTMMLSAASIAVASFSASIGLFVHARKEHISMKELEQQMHNLVPAKAPPKSTS